MTEETARYLVSDDGRRLLDEIAALPGDAPQWALALRRKRDLPPEIAAAAVEVADARRRARSRYPDADRLFFTGESLAQATSPAIARFHASRLAPLGIIADPGCGVGMDALALAEAGATEVLAIERDAARLVFARANAEARGVAGRIRFVHGDVTMQDWQADAVFWDPARRNAAGGRVSRDAERYEPPLSFLGEIRKRAPRGGIAKLSPALPDDVLRDLGGVTLFLSEDRTCKEACVLWGDALAGGDPSHSGALLLPENLLLPTGEEPPPIAAEPGAFVFDPDPATVRAGALGALCERLGASLLTPEDAYLTGDGLPPPGGAARRAASAYCVRETLPYKPRAVAERLRAWGIVRLVVKKRHFPLEPDAVARELGLRPGAKGPEATLILARQSGKGFLAVLCEPALGAAAAEPVPADADL